MGRRLLKQQIGRMNLMIVHSSDSSPNFPVLREFLRARLFQILGVVSVGQSLASFVVEGVREYPVGWRVGNGVAFPYLTGTGLTSRGLVDGVKMDSRNAISTSMRRG